MPCIFDSVTLPGGRTVTNRLVKVAMYEHLASFFGGPPNEYHLALYSEWAKHSWGMIITGNVEISPTHLTLGRDMLVPPVLTDESLLPFERLASAMRGFSGLDSQTGQDPGGPLAIMQLNHPGRQSTNFIGGRFPFQPPMAPSAIRVGSGRQTFISRIIQGILFQTPKPMQLSDIEEMIAQFVHGANLAHKAGFDGVQLHIAHGYLLAQFLSPKSNARTDEYSVNNSLKLIHRIVASIRAIVPNDFVLGIKLNAGDYTAGNLPDTLLTDGEKRAMSHLLAIAQWGGVDFIEISGGDYEKPDFMLNAPLKSARHALFSRFSHQTLQALEKIPRTSTSPPLPLVLLTGGLRTPGLLHTALASKHADLLGIGRGSVLCPNLPSLLKDKAQDTGGWNDLPFQTEPNLGKNLIFDRWPLNWLWHLVPKVSLIGAGVSMAWYIVAMHQLSYASLSGTMFQPDYGVSGLQGVVRMWSPTNSYSGRNGGLSACFMGFLGIIFMVFVVYVLNIKLGAV